MACGTQTGAPSQQTTVTNTVATNKFKTVDHGNGWYTVQHIATTRCFVVSFTYNTRAMVETVPDVCR